MRFFIGLLLASSLSAAALAQDTQAAVEDEVIAEGKRLGADDAMDAFLRGDYATAEIEFEENFSRLRRAQRLRETAIQQGASDAISAQVSEGAGIGASTPQTGQTARGTDIFGTPTSYANNRVRKDDPDTISSGSDLGNQLYMAGLSEIQLGKLDEAKESFARALKLNETLHDARFRLALLALQDGNTEEARDHLTHMEKALRNCHSRCERLGNREVLETGISQLKGFLEAA